MAQPKSQSRWRPRAAVLGFVVVIAVVSLVAMATARALANPENYDLAATRACLHKSAFASEMPRRDALWSFPALRVRFHGEGFASEVRLYFAPDTDAAKGAEVPDSERMQRRRNVLTESVASALWDERVVRCLHR